MTLVLASKAPNQYTSSRQLVAGADMNNIIAQLNTIESGITAFAGGGKASARQLTAAVNTIATVATAAEPAVVADGKESDASRWRRVKLRPPPR